MNDLSVLSAIKGIGRETVADLKRIYKNMDELTEALRNDKVSLRNDIVKILKDNLIV